MDPHVLGQAEDIQEIAIIAALRKFVIEDDLVLYEEGHRVCHGFPSCIAYDDIWCIPLWMLSEITMLKIL